MAESCNTSFMAGFRGKYCAIFQSNHPITKSATDSSEITVRNGIIEELKNRTRSLRSLFGEPLDWTNRLSEFAAAAVRAVASRIEVEVPCEVVAAVRTRIGRPVVAVQTGIVERRPVAAAGEGKEDTCGSVSAPATNAIPIHAVNGCPFPITLAREVV